MGEALIVRKGGSGKPEGQHVWAKYESFLPDISISMNLPSTATAVLTVECELIDLTQVDVNFFAGYKGHVIVHGNECPLEFLENGKAIFTWGGTPYEKNVTYTPSTKTMTIADQWSGVFTNTFTKDGTIFSGYAVSDDESAYPNNGVHTDGYYYIKYDYDPTEDVGATGIDYGEFTADGATTFTVPHNLGVVPRRAYLISNGNVGVTNITGLLTKNEVSYSRYAAGSLQLVNGISLTANNMTFQAYSANVPFKGSYTWIAIA